MAKIPAALGVNGHWLLTGEGPMEPPGEQPDIELARREGAMQAATAIQAAIDAVAADLIRGATSTPTPAQHDQAVAEVEQAIGRAMRGRQRSA